MPELFTLSDGRVVTAEVISRGSKAILYDSPLDTESPVIAVGGEAVLRLANLNCLQDTLRTATDWSTTQRIGPRISYVDTDTSEHFQWLVEELANEYDLNPTLPLPNVPSFVRTRIGFEDLPATVREKPCIACGNQVDTLDDTIVFCSAPIHGSCGDEMAEKLDAVWKHTDEFMAASL